MTTTHHEEPKVKARKGMLVVFEHSRSYTRVHGETVRSVVYELGTVEAASREGLARAIREWDGGVIYDDRRHLTYLVNRWWIVPQLTAEQIPTEWARPAWDSLDQARDALRSLAPEVS